MYVHARLFIFFSPIVKGFFMPAYTLEMKNVEVMGIQRMTLNLH